MSTVVHAQVTADVISVGHLSALVASPTAGATATFSGDVRDNDHGKKVLSLEYEIHPSAQEVLEKVVIDIAGRHAIEHVAVSHRFGQIPIGEAALVVCVSAQHREPAFDACRELVDEVKKHIPIWKHQVFADGTDEWVNCA